MRTLSYLLELYRMLSPRERIELHALQALIIVASLCEVAGVLSIGPFVAMAMDESRIASSPVLSAVQSLSGISTPRGFVIAAGFSVLAILIASSAFSVIANWRLLLFGERFGAALSTRLFAHYLELDWLYHTQKHSGVLGSAIANDCTRVTKYLINPALQINSRIFVVLAFGAALVLLDPVATLGVSVLFVGLYGFLLFILRRRLLLLGQTTTTAYSMRFKTVAEAFGGIKDVLLLNRQAHFVDAFNRYANISAQSESQASMLGVLPKFAVELLAFGTIVSVILYVIITTDAGMGGAIPSLAVYAFAGFKLLPAFQQLYSASTLIRSNVASYTAIRDDLVAAETVVLTGGRSRDSGSRLPFEKELEFRGVSLAYPGKRKLALDDIDLKIPARSLVGLVGPSGSGKSTILDILLGLVPPSRGQVLADGVPIEPGNVKGWRTLLGYVPQSIFVADVSILENIAFGLPSDRIDRERAMHSARLANLEDLVTSLPDGIDTRIGERGVQLSGGQRQRIGIARALYSDPPVLVFDEATSALDGLTENSIMESIQALAGQKTIVLVAHRLSTVRDCDIIYFVQKGKLSGQGTYDELFTNNEQFRKMALAVAN